MKKLLSALAICALLFCLAQVLAQREVLRDFNQKLKQLERLQEQVVNLSHTVKQLEDRSQSGLPASETQPSSTQEVIRPTRYVPGGAERDDPFQGPKDSKVLFMAFFDFQCSPCRSFVKSTLPELKRTFFSDKVRFLVRDFPLQSKKYSQQAATFAHCAGEQGRYWEAFELLFNESNFELVDKGEFSALSDLLSGIKKKRFLRCINSGRYEQEIADDRAEGRSLGVVGAPAFFIGREVEEGAAFTGVLVRGAQPYAILANEVQKLLE